eukprot:2339738-Amphidinium_carterae.1
MDRAPKTKFLIKSDAGIATAKGAQRPSHFATVVVRVSLSFVLQSCHPAMVAKKRVHQLSLLITQRVCSMADSDQSQKWPCNRPVRSPAYLFPSTLPRARSCSIQHFRKVDPDPHAKKAQRIMKQVKSRQVTLTPFLDPKLRPEEEEEEEEEEEDAGIFKKRKNGNCTRLRLQDGRSSVASSCAALCFSRGTQCPPPQNSNGPDDRQHHKLWAAI